MLVTGRFVNRGLLNGPYCPIYGFGAVIVLACLTPLEDQLSALCLGSVFLTSVLEWLTGFILVKLFNQRWWGYSGKPFNLGGYICLRFSIIWRLACVFVVELLHPTIMLFIRIIPRTFGIVILTVFGIALAVDLAATVSAIVKLNRRLIYNDELAFKLKAVYDDFGEDLSRKIMDAAARGSEWKENPDSLSAKLEERHADLTGRLEDRKLQKDKKTDTVPPTVGGLEPLDERTVQSGTLWTTAPAVRFS